VSLYNILAVSPKEVDNADTHLSPPLIPLRTFLVSVRVIFYSFVPFFRIIDASSLPDCHANSTFAFSSSAQYHPSHRISLISPVVPTLIHARTWLLSKLFSEPG
jgi:hypothetical protein